MLVKRMYKIQGRNADIREKILQRWNKYIGELFPDQREQPAIYRSTDELEILKTETEAALSTLNRNKAAGPDTIVIEMLATFGDFGINKITEIIN